MKRVSALLFLSLMMFLPGCKKSEAPSKNVVAAEKSPAPDISVVSVATGAPLTLSSLKGKVVLLNFWATWCPPCREEMPSMVKLNSFMAGKPFQMVAVSIDDGGKPAIDAFFKDNGYSLPAYLDASGASSKAYGITGVPETFIIDRQGILVKKIVGGLAWDSPDVIAFLEGLMK